MTNDSRPVAALSRPVAALSSDSRRLVAHSRKVENSLSLVPAVHLVPLVKGRNNESSPKLPFYTARLIVYVDRAFVFFYPIVFPPFCHKAVKQTDETNRPFKQFDLSL